MYIVLLCILIYINNYYCIYNYHDINILNPSDDYIEYQYNYHTLHYVSFVPPLDSFFKCVKYNNIILWESNNDIMRCVSIKYHKNEINRCILSLHYYNENNIFKTQYLELTNGNWINLNITQYLNSLHSIVTEKILNISIGSVSITSINNITKIGNKYTIYDLNNKYVVRIIDNNGIIWARNYENQYCTKTVIYYRNNLLILLHLEINYNNLITNNYYLKNFNEWQLIPQDKFQFLENAIINETKLNINNCDDNEFKIINHQPYGINCKIFNAAFHIHTTEVVDDNVQLWKSINGIDKCTFVAIHLYNDKPILAQLYIKTSEPSDGNIYFIKLDDKYWIEINKDTFFTVLNSYDQQNNN